jgi:hypothetical protein
MGEYNIAVHEFRESAAQIGLLARKPVQGPEFTLVQLFAEHLVCAYRSSDSKSVALFYEPHADGSFPDLVVVEYDLKVFEKWSPARFLLGSVDTRILNQLHTLQRSDVPNLESRLGYGRRILQRSLERLEKANLAECINGAWMPAPLQQVFGIRRLMAIEAKIGDWRGAFRQADVNSRFASECYVLLPPHTVPEKYLHKGHEHIGVFSCHVDGLAEIRPSQRKALPISHTSWMFNEWIGRSIHVPQSET